MDSVWGPLDEILSDVPERKVLVASQNTLASYNELHSDKALTSPCGVGRSGVHLPSGLVAECVYIVANRRKAVKIVC